MPRERLPKIISQAGIASRREAERLIAAGLVTVNGQVVTTAGAKADPEQDHIKVKGRLLSRFPRRTYLLLNKPAGYITTLKDPQGRPKVTDLVKGIKVRLFPVGRLDYDAEGLLILSNDGLLANDLMHPRNQVERSYEVQVEGVVSPRNLVRLRQGIELSEGKTLPARVRMVKRVKAGCLLSLTLKEGRNRQIKRMMAAIGHRVVKLTRVRFGPLQVADLAPGQFRHLTSMEIDQLRRVAGSHSFSLEP